MKKIIQILMASCSVSLLLSGCQLIQKFRGEEATEEAACYEGEIEMVEAEEMDVTDELPMPTKSEVIELINKTIPVQENALSEEFKAIRKQCRDAPGEVWDGGFLWYNGLDNLLFEGEDEPVATKIILKTDHFDPEHKVIIYDFDYIPNWYSTQGFNKDDRMSAKVQLLYENGRWVVDDMTSPLRDNQSHKGHMQLFIKSANEAIKSGQLERDVNETFSYDGAESQRQEYLDQIRSYRKKYNI